MTSYCSGTHSPGISSRHNRLSRGPGTTARRRFPSKIFFEICGKPPGRKRFSATPDWMHIREKSFNPLQSGSKLLHKCAKRQSSVEPKLRLVGTFCFPEVAHVTQACVKFPVIIQTDHCP